MEMRIDSTGPTDGDSMQTRSLIELVLDACELSEDLVEICDWVDEVVVTGRSARAVEFGNGLGPIPA